VHTSSADGDRAGAEFSSYTRVLPSGGASVIATCTALESACCLHVLEDAEIEKGQGEWRLMVQICCRCPLDKQDAFLELVRGFEAGDVSADWRQHLPRPLGPNLQQAGPWSAAGSGHRREGEGGGGAGISIHPQEAVPEALPAVPGLKKAKREEEMKAKKEKKHRQAAVASPSRPPPALARGEAALSPNALCARVCALKHPGPSNLPNSCCPVCLASHQRAARGRCEQLLLVTE
jgi:hypothetical protein